VGKILEMVNLVIPYWNWK